MAKVLVTGATGFIGQHLVRLLLDRGYQVRCLVRHTSRFAQLEHWGVELVYGALEDPPSLFAATKDVNVVYHLAGVVSALAPQVFYAANGEGTYQMALAAQKAEVERVVYVSSLAAGGPSVTPRTEDEPPAPINAYGKSKLDGEKHLARLKGLPYTIIRPPWVYGPGDRAMARLCRLALRGWLPLLGTGQRQVSFVHASDLVEGILAAAEAKIARGQVYYLCEPQGYTHTELGKLVCAALGVPLRYRHIPEWLPTLAALAGEGLQRLSGRMMPLNLHTLAQLAAPGWLCSPERAERELGYRSRYSLPEALPELVRWYRERRWL